MKLNKFLFVLLFLSSNFNVVIAQNRQVEVQLEPMEIEGLGGTQSYAFGQFDGKWLIIGGRLDGLHRRQPFASFDVAGHNTDLIVEVNRSCIGISRGILGCLCSKHFIFS